MLVEANDLTKTYKMGKVEVHALQGVTISVERGEFLSIMGPSGSGKSTLMHLLGCLDRPTSGSYRLDGTAVEILNDFELSRLRNRKVGFIFQAFNLISQLDIIENVEIPLIYMGVERNERIEMCREMLRIVGLGQRSDHRPNELSGGECQRVAIARALVTSPDIIFADEPTGNLDTKTGSEIMELLQSMNEKGTTIVLVTHEVDKAAYSKRVVQMKDGQIIRELLGAEIDQMVEQYMKMPVV